MERDPWNKGWLIDEARREVYRNRSRASSQAKARASRGEGPEPIHDINEPRLRPEHLMPLLPGHGLRALSLFSGCGGLDIGFERAGYEHVASYDYLEPAGKTLTRARPDWRIFSGEAGDVTNVNWRRYRGSVDVLHGGPPCQPFSMAGRQQGADDKRDMFPEFVRAVLEIQPEAFIAENVAALGHTKFEEYVSTQIVKPLSKSYSIHRFLLEACDFGLPQSRRRLFFIGFCNKRAAARFVRPVATHDAEHLRKGARSRQPILSITLPGAERQLTMGVRESLGLSDIGFDALAPTIRSTLTGPRHTTSILSSVSAQRIWAALKIWPNGVAATREAARQFVAANGDFRMSVADCAMIQGFPTDWPIFGSVYVALGQIGNAVAPPMAYNVAASVAAALV